MNAPLGLCSTCQHAHLILNDRGSQFLFCQASKAIPSLPKYPALPVRHCTGYQKKEKPEA